MIPRFFCPDPLAPGAVMDLPRDAAHHAVRVLRLREGDLVQLFDGSGGEWRARIQRVKPAVRVTLEEFAAADREAPLHVTLVQGVAGGDKMDWVIQKAVELGVAAIRPVLAKRSVVRLSGERSERRIQHWRSIVIASCEQSRRNRIPQVEPLVDLPQYLALPPQQNECRLILSPGAALRIRDVPPPAGPTTILVGPEGGFEEGEAAAAELAGFVPVCLGPRVLRTETAGAAALAAIMALWGDV